MMEWLRGIAATAGVMPSQKDADVGEVVQEIGFTRCTPHMVSDRISA